MERGTNRIANYLTKGENTADLFEDDHAFGVAGERGASQETEDILRKFVSFGNPPTIAPERQEGPDNQVLSDEHGGQSGEGELDLASIAESVLAVAVQARQAVYDLQLENEALAKELASKDEQVKSLKDQVRKAKRRISDLERSRQGYKDKHAAAAKRLAALESERDALKASLEDAEAKAKAAAEMVENRYTSDVHAPAELSEALADSPFFETYETNPPSFSMPK